MIKQILRYTLAVVTCMTATYAQPQVVPSMLMSHTMIAPGETLTVGVHLDLAPGWHVYWKNPGDTGIPTRISWHQDTAQTTMGAMSWPAPIRFETEGLESFGYKDHVTFPFIAKINGGLTQGTTVTMSAEVSWLACKDICVPGSATVTASVIVAAVSRVNTVAEQRIQEAIERVPGPVSDIKWESRVSGNTLVLHRAKTAAPYTFLDVFPETQGGLLSVVVTANQIEMQVDTDFWLTDISGIVRLETQEGIKDVPFKEGMGKIATAAPETGGSWTLLAMILGAFLGGIILNVMPCVFPVLSLKLLQFLPKQERGPELALSATLRRHILAYTLGILCCFWVMAGVLLTLRATLGVVGWGIQLQYPVVVFGLILLFVILALNLFGVFEIGLSLQKWGQIESKRSEITQEFLSGVLITVVATPCTAPFLGAAIGFALSQPAWVAVVVLTAMALGLASPMLVVATFPVLVRWLPRPGAWMQGLRQFLGFPMLATVVWLLWVLLQQWGMPLFVPVTMLFLGVALGLWVVGQCQHRGRLKLGGILFIVLLVGAAFAYRSFSTVGAKARASSQQETGFQPFSRTTLENAIAEGRPVFVDVTAAWCLTCQVNKKLVLHTDAAQALFAAHKVLLLRADWTNQDQEITKYLAAFGRSGVPMYVYYRPGREPAVLPELLRMGTLVEVLGGEARFPE